MELGVCSCPAGLNGNACVHQAAVSLHFHVGGINVVVCWQPTTLRSTCSWKRKSTKWRLLCQSSIEASVSHAHFNEAGDLADSEVECLKMVLKLLLIDLFDCYGWSEWWRGGRHFELTIIGNVVDDIQKRICLRDPQFNSGINKFCKVYNKSLSKSYPTLYLASVFYSFNCSSFNSPVSTFYQHCAAPKFGKKISVQPSASVRRKSAPYDNWSSLSGRPTNLKRRRTDSQENEELIDHYTLPVLKKKKSQGKRKHSLQESIVSGTQNAGKWWRHSVIISAYIIHYCILIFSNVIIIIHYDLNQQS